MNAQTLIPLPLTRESQKLAAMWLGNGEQE